MSLNFFEHRFIRSEAARIAGISEAQLRGWMQDQKLNISPQHKGGTGNRRLFSPYDILKICCLAELAAFRVPPSVAGEAITSKKFRSWAEKIISPRQDDESVCYVMIFYRQNEVFVAQFTPTETEWDIFLSDHEHVPTSRKAYFTILLGDLLQHVKAECSELIHEESPEEFSTEDQIILNYRKHHKGISSNDE